jgi:hypothetical protein
MYFGFCQTRAGYVFLLKCRVFKTTCVFVVCIMKKVCVY